MVDEGSGIEDIFEHKKYSRGVKGLYDLPVLNPTTYQDYLRNMIYRTIRDFCSVAGRVPIVDRIEFQEAFLKDGGSLCLWGKGEYEKAEKLGIPFEGGHETSKLDLIYPRNQEKATGINSKPRGYAWNIYGIPAKQLQKIEDHYLFHDKLHHSWKVEREIRENSFNEAMLMFLAGKKEQAIDLLEKIKKSRKGTPSRLYLERRDIENLLLHFSNGIKADYEFNKSCVNLSEYLIKQSGIIRK